jgi:hypothetical protein
MRLPTSVLRAVEKHHAVATCFAALLLTAGARLVFHTPSDANAGVKRLAADRKLSAAELDELLAMSDVLISKREDPGRRRGVANRLGEDVAHKYAIPALVAVLRDPREDDDVRIKCVLALSWIRDKRVLDFLIDALSDSNSGVAFEAHSQLQKLTEQSFEYERFDEDPKSEMRQSLHKKWHDWWESHRDTATMTWENAHIQF